MDTHETLRKNIVIRVFKKFVPVTSHYDPNGAFFVPIDKVRVVSAHARLTKF